MKALALVVDEREFSTIEAALLLLQEQITALPEDLSEMMSAHGPPLTEREVGEFVRRIIMSQRRSDSSLGTTVPRPEMLVEIEKTAELGIGSEAPRLEAARAALLRPRLNNAAPAPQADFPSGK